MKELFIDLVANSDVQARPGGEVNQLMNELRPILPGPPRFRFTGLRLLFGSGDRRFARGGLCIAQVSASLPLRGWGCSFAGLTGEA